VIRAILTDIEGTTSSISFVKDVLFPFARERLPTFIEAAREAGLVSATQAEIVALLQRWIDEDRKATPLKALQGMIWEDGYREGAFRAHVYPEVAQRLRDWKAQRIELYVFSSGSVPAQKLLFRHSEAGDLTPLFSGYFDTEIGAKREADSYRRILAVIGRPGAEILFLSDIVAELDAARAAGMGTTLLARPPTACPADSAHLCVADFDAITLD